MQAMTEHQRIAPRSGAAFRLRRGQRLQVIDAQGGQVSDLFAVDAHDLDHWLSSGRSIDYADTIYLTTGHQLYSNRSQPMFTIVRDDADGCHDFLLTPCSHDTFEILYGDPDHPPGCFENLSGALAAFGVAPDRIATTFNIFMDVSIGDDGRLSLTPPSTRAGDLLELRAEMDLIVGLTACAAEKTNGGSFGPIDYTILG